MVNVMQSLGRAVAQPMAMWIAEMEGVDAKMGEAEMEPGSEIDYSTDSEVQPKSPVQKQPVFERDPELEREERLIQILQEKKKLESRLEDALEELKESKERAETLQDDLEETKYNLDRRHARGDDSDLAQLNKRADHDREIIAELETDLASARATIEQQEKHLKHLKSDEDSKQDLRDQVHLLSAERDDLQKKTKANENLKKKIQSLQEQESNTKSMRRELQAAQDQLQDYERVHDRCLALEKANEENAQTIANGEQEIFDQKQARKRLDHELKVYQQKFEQSRDLLNNAQETIRDLEEKLHSHGGDGDALENLDDELNEDRASGDDGRDEIKKPARMPTTSAETIVLHQNLEIAKAANSRLEQRCLDLLQENLGFKAVIDEAVESRSAELHPFQHQARRLEELAKALDDSKSSYIAASTMITDLKQRLGAAQGTGKYYTLQEVLLAKFGLNSNCR
jgi:protein HOOK3